MAWLGHDVQSRKKGIDKLLSLVRMPLLSPSVRFYYLLTFNFLLVFIFTLKMFNGRNVQQVVIVNAILPVYS